LAKQVVDAVFADVDAGHRQSGKRLKQRPQHHTTARTDVEQRLRLQRVQRRDDALHPRQHPASFEAMQPKPRGSAGGDGAVVVAGRVKAEATAAKSGAGRFVHRPVLVVLVVRVVCLLVRHET
jgi:hypothetical protein